MKTKLSAALALSALCVFSATVSYADDDSKKCLFVTQPVSVTQIEKNAQELGFKPYNEFFEKKIKLTDSCVYKIEVKDDAGQKWKMYFDPTTGKAIAKRPD